MESPDRGGRRRLPGLRVLAAALILAIALGVAACGDDDDGGGGGGGEASAAERDAVSIGVELVGGGDFISETQTGAKQAAEDLGPVDLSINLPPPGINAAIAQQQVNDMLVKRPDAMAIAPLPPDLWRRTLTTVTEQVDHTLATLIKPANTPDDLGGIQLKTYVGINDLALGASSVRETIKRAKIGKDATGLALIGQCVPGNSGTLWERGEGARRAIAEALPNVEIKIFDSKPTPEENTNAWEAALQANPEPVLATGTCDIDGASLYRLNKRSGAKFPVAALETPPDTLRGVKDGTIAATAAVNWWLSGYATVRVLADAARGGEVPEGWIDTGFTIVTPDNVDEIETRDSSAAEAARWYAPKVERMFADLRAKPLADAWK